MAVEGRLRFLNHLRLLREGVQQTTLHLHDKMVSVLFGL